MLPNRLKTKVKDRLRDVRFVARELRPPAPREVSGERLDAEPSVTSGLARIIADFSDGAFQTLETVAIGLLSSDPEAHSADARAYPLSRYRGPDRAGSQALFARDCYFAAKQLLLAKGMTNPRVHEELFAAAYRVAAEQWEAAAADRHEGEDSTLATTARDAAAISLAVLRTHPVAAPLVFDDPAGDRRVDAESYVALALGLATAVATYHGDLIGADDAIYPGVCAAIDARYEALEKAAADPDGADDLARIFADLAPHLP